MVQGRRTSRAALRLEVLERRLLLAGDVFVGAAGGDLIVLGDAAGNEITVQQIGAGEYRVTGEAGTTVNGGPDAVVNGVRDDFKLWMGEGDDVVRIIGDTEVPDDIDARLGEGDNELVLQDLTFVGDDVKVTGGGGNDLVQVRGDSVVGDDLSANLGDGDNSVTLDDDAVVEDKVTVRTGNGQDDVDVDDRALIGGKVDVRTGCGDDVVAIREDAQVEGKVKIDTGTGDDEVEVSGDAMLLDNLAINTAWGNDYVGVTDQVFVVGKLDIHTDGGEDTVVIDGDGQGVVVVGKTKITTDTAPGNDMVEIGDAFFGDDLSLETASGAGSDMVYIDDTIVEGDVSIRTSGGLADNDIVEIGLFDSGNGLFCDGLKIGTGKGRDLVTVANSFIARAQIKGGSEVDVVTIFDNEFNELLIDLGTGNDTLAADGGGNDVAARTLLNGGADYDKYLRSGTNTFNGEKIKGLEALL